MEKNADQGIVMEPRALLDRLIDYERRVRSMYLALGDRVDFPATLRYLWNSLAEDERHHLAILERSAALLDVMDSPPVVPEEMLAGIETQVTTAEAVLQRPELSIDDALRQALRLEGSELNSLDEAWFRGFRPAVGALLRAMIPTEDTHIRRLVEGVHTFSPDKGLQHQAADVWTQYQKGQQRFTLNQTT
jgi:rubrerythrin